ncbi:MAG: hypothetical protein IJX93_09730 [Clostridia bacterium]|nr:hypothetical protein [Clostridia bacterium]
MKIRFLFPIDGDVLTPDDGELITEPLYGERLWIPVRLLVSGVVGSKDIDVTVNERKAERVLNPGRDEIDTACDAVYTVKVPLDGIRTTLDARAFGADAVIRVWRFREAYRKYRLAIDDIVWSMMELTERADEISSIFEVPFFGLFRDLHGEYGTKVHMNIYYTDETGRFTLEQVPDKFKEEFIANSEWLKFTFHARANLPNHIYQHAPYSELLHDYHQVTNEILRFAGPEVNTDVNGLHFAETTLEGARALRSVGIRCLVGYYTTENGCPSIAYYLNREQNAHCCGRDFWVDNAEDIIFSKDKMVIDQFRLDEIRPRLDYLKNECPHEAGTMNFVTHEQYFYPKFRYYQEDYRKKIFTAVGWAAENGYDPCFLDDVFR